MFHTNLKRLFSPAAAGIAPDEVAAMHATVARLREMSDRIVEYCNPAADYRRFRDAAVASGDLEELEEIGDLDSFARKYAAVQENLSLASREAHARAWLKHRSVIDRIVQWLAALVEEREEQEKQTARDIGVAWEPSSATRLLRKQLNDCRAVIERAENGGPPVHLVDIVTQLFPAEKTAPAELRLDA